MGRADGLCCVGLARYGVGSGVLLQLVGGLDAALMRWLIRVWADGRWVLIQDLTARWYARTKIPQSKLMV